MYSMTHRAKKIVIITEKVIADGVLKLIEDCGASGYTTVAAGGRGSRGVRSIEPNPVSDSYANVKIEVITGNDELAQEIADRVAEEYFSDYSGITYLEDVEILRPHKFDAL